MNCVECGKRTGNVVFDDLKNLSRAQVLCKECQTLGFMKIETDETIEGRILYEVNPLEIIKQTNPDISCDFCSKPDPEWLYDLKMEPLEVKGQKLDLGTRWASCDGCATEADEKSPLGTVLRLGQMGDVTNIMQIHSMVMDNISNKRTYVRSEEDGVIRKV